MSYLESDKDTNSSEQWLTASIVELDRMPPPISTENTTQSDYQGNDTK